MATENCTADWDLPLSSLLHSSSRKRRHRISSQLANPPPPLIRQLGDDLLVEILIRLPDPGSACRSKAVCKQWSTLISDPSFSRRFISHHRSINERDPPGLLPSYDPDHVLSFLPVPNNVRPELRVLDSFQDLLLCGFQETSGAINSELEGLYFVCNPFTKECITLPLVPKTTGYRTSGTGTSSRLVCEPLGSSHQLGDEPEPDPAFAYSEYRFRVVCVYQVGACTALDVFCSESGRWKKEAFLQSDLMRAPDLDVVSWNGELFWACHERDSLSLKLAVFNPFHLDIPPTSMNLPPCAVLEKLRGGRRHISVSQGALHVTLLEVEGRVRHCSRSSLSVWRLEQDGKSWTKQYDITLGKKKAKYFRYCDLVDMHPEKPEIVFLQYSEYSDRSVLSCNLRTGELELLSELRYHLPTWRMFQPRVSCWPTPIPRCKKLREGCISPEKAKQLTLRRGFKMQKMAGVRR